MKYNLKQKDDSFTLPNEDRLYSGSQDSSVLVGGLVGTLM
jgi:hypothetical protein